MPPKSNRLNLKKDFKWMVAGEKIDTKYATIYIRKGNNELPKIAVALSSKHFRKAVDRNKVKRAFYRALSSIYNGLPRSVNIIALPKPLSLNVKSISLAAELKSLKILDD